jgi:hypothetical protein
MRGNTLFRATARALTLLVIAVTATPAAAQRSIDNRVRIALPDRFPLADARALVVRYSSIDNPDVIILDPAHATSETLSAALTLLRHLDKERPPAPGRYVVATLKGFAPLGHPDPAALRRLAGQLAALRAQPSSRIGNLGRGRWIELASPRSRS